MNEVFADLVKLWPILNGGLIVSLITIFLKNKYENRKLTIEENAGLRKEFIEEMTALRDEVKGLRRENDQLRDEVRSLHGVIDGMRRSTMQAAISAQEAVVRELPMSDHMRRALGSLDEIAQGAQHISDKRPVGSVEGDTKR